MENLPVLEDTDFNVTKRFLHEQLTSTTEEWSNILFIEKISKSYRFLTYDTTKAKIIHLLSTCMNEIIRNPQSTEKTRKRATRLLNTVSLIVESRPAIMIINANVKKQSRQILRDSLIQKEYDQLTQINTESNVGASNQETERLVPIKKRKYLKRSYFKDLGYADKVTTLNEYYGAENVLDLTKAGTIPSRFKSVVGDLCTAYNLQLALQLQDKEYRVIQKLGSCITKEELYYAVDDINPFDNASELPYIKLATQKLCAIIFNDVFKAEHHEDWYRTNVYGDLFDFIFSVKSGYETKRSECHSQIIKSLRGLGTLSPEQKNIKLDFIFTHTFGLSDGFFCEDKPTSKKSNKDNQKAKDLREKALVYWSSLLPYEECIEYITAVSCQFNKLQLQVKGTKIINGVTVHANLKDVSIPNDEQDGAGLAEYLSAVISLVRMVLQNFEIIKTIINVVKKDDLLFLSPAKISDEPFREDSSRGSGSTTSTASTSSSVDVKWQRAERKLRVLEKIEVAIKELKEKARSSYLNISWEDIYIKEQVA